MSLEPIRERRPRVDSPRSRRNGALDAPSPGVEPTFFSRYECKYVVDPAILPDLREFLRPFTRLDAYAARREGGRYPICSLYLDSPDLLLYQQTVGGERDRYKLRIRAYSDEPGKPVFAEVKRKLNNIVHKRRAALSREHARQLLRRGWVDPGVLPPGERADAEYFESHVSLTEARPVVRVKYLREAYQATGNEPVRITIDTDLEHAITLDDNLSHREGRWTSTPLRGVIIEVKFTERFPWWVQDLVRTFGFHQRAVPKYVKSIDHMMLDGRESSLSLAGITLPPLRRA